VRQHPADRGFYVVFLTGLSWRSKDPRSAGELDEMG